MESASFIEDAEFWLPPEFLIDEDFLVEKENNGGLGLGFTVKPKGNEENFLAGLTRQMVQSTLEDDFSGGFATGNDNKTWGMNRSPQSTLCTDGIGCGCRKQWSMNQNRQSRVSSQAAWDLYCNATEEVAIMNINEELYDYNNHCRRGLLDLPRKYSAAAKNLNNSSGYYSRQSLTYQKLHAIQQMKQQQLIKHHRQMLQQSRGGGRVISYKNGGFSDSSSSAWSHQRDNSDMRVVFLGDHSVKRGSTGTGVFLPRTVNHTSPSSTAETRKKPTFTTVLVPARVAEVLNLDESVVHSSTNLNEDTLWRQHSNNGGFSSQMKIEQPVNELRLPSDWAY